MRNQFEIPIATSADTESPAKHFDVPIKNNADIEKSENKEVVKTNNKTANYIPFDPGEELRGIADFTVEELSGLTSGERMAIKKVRLEEYKKELARQKIEMAYLNAGLEEMILSHKEIDRESINKYVLERAGEGKLTEHQLAQYQKILNKVEKQNLIIKDFSQKYKGRENEFFKDMFGKSPYGKISIEAGAISLAVVCEDERDFGWIMKQKYNEQQTDYDLEKTESFYCPASGCAVRKNRIQKLAMCVTAINVPEVRKHALSEGKEFWTEQENAMLHEEKHIVNHLASEGNYNLKKENDYNFEENKSRAKDEILAHFKGGSDIGDIGLSLDGAIGYNYFKKDRDSLNNRIGKLIAYSELESTPQSERDVLAVSIEKIQKNINEIEEKIKIYNRHASEALNSMYEMEMAGYSRGEIIGLFQNENLGSWGKTYERIKNSNEFKKRKEIPLSKINERIAEIKTSIEISKDEIREVEEYGEANRKRSKFSKVLRVIFGSSKEAALSRKDPEVLNRYLKSNMEYHEDLLKKKEELESL